MSLVCWKCGASLAGMPLPLARRDTCPSCRVDLHVCKLCRHYDAHRAGQCRELAADRVADKTRVNDCGWFVPRPEAYRGGGAVMAQPGRSALDALFSNASGTNQPADGEPDKPVPPASLDDLFRK
ncbi:hypothetical protein [Thiobacillus thioparus]|jgi:hypothetical protein|uniref:hypothetical protein n=1 Tax=Thiobacillus thioparus TaxID=931 RepID=UPI0003804287|nr:hypothetical protein [Thiobacillus thioparus]